MYKIQTQSIDYGSSEENEWVETDDFYTTIEEAIPIALFCFSCKINGRYSYYVRIVNINNIEVFWLTYRDIELIKQIYVNYKTNIIDDVMRHIHNNIKHILIEKGINTMRIVVNLNEFFKALEFAKQFSAGKKDPYEFLQGICIVFNEFHQICVQGADGKILGSSKEFEFSEDTKTLTELITRIPLSASVLFNLINFIKKLKKEKIIKEFTLVDISLYAKNTKIVFTISGHMFQAMYGDHYPDIKKIIQPSMPQEVVSDIPVDLIKTFLESIPIDKKIVSPVDIVLYDGLLILKNTSTKVDACLFSKSPNNLDCLILKVDFTNQNSYNTNALYCGRFNAVYLLKVLNPFSGLVGWSFTSNSFSGLEQLVITQEIVGSPITYVAGISVRDRLEFNMFFEGKDI